MLGYANVDLRVARIPDIVCNLGTPRMPPKSGKGTGVPAPGVPAEKIAERVPPPARAARAGLYGKFAMLD